VQHQAQQEKRMKEINRYRPSVEQNVYISQRHNAEGNEEDDAKA
jgi:hypothetical protein